MDGFLGVRVVRSSDQPALPGRAQRVALASYLDDVSMVEKPIEHGAGQSKVSGALI
jgi:hypothetical protein